MRVFKRIALVSSAAILLILVLFFFLPAVAGAARTWSRVAQDTQGYLLQAAKAYRNGKSEEAKKLINQGYFGPFESEGMEATIRTHISAQRAFELEQEFKQLKMLINSGAPPAKVYGLVSKLGLMLQEDAAKLDGEGATGAASSTPFFQSLVIILREGFEAILILSAIVAYLVKSGNKEKVRTVYLGALLALLASVITVVALKLLFSGIGTFSREVLEGATMLLAVVVLFWVSSWLTGKIQARKWQEYIEGKVKASVTTGSTFALAAVAFLAVYREGAETILFYEALVSRNPAATGPVVFGFIAGCVALVGIFLAFKYGSVRVPIKPFFIATSILLYYLAFVFAGQGIRELQEAGLIGSTVIKGMPVIDLLGVYPTWETLSLQIALVFAAAGGLVWQFRPSRKRAAALG